MININFGGDLMLGRGIRSRLDEIGEEAVFNQIEGYFTPDEYNVCNLEAPFSNSGKPYWAKDKNITFGINESMVSALKQINLRVAILGNNHITDYGLDGVSKSIEVLKEAGILYTGAGDDLEKATIPVIIKEDGIEIAIFSFCAFSINAKAATKSSWGMAFFDYQTVKTAISKYSSICKVILCIHWGIDYYQYPVKTQINVAKKIIDEFHQVICVIGHHPHVIQPVFDYRQARIFLSLGNLAFDEPKDLSRVGMVVKMRIDCNYNVSYDTSFVCLASDNTMQPLDDDTKQKELSRLAHIKDGIDKGSVDYLLVDERWALSMLYSIFENWQVANLYRAIRLYGLIRIFKVILRKIMEYIKND